VQLKGLDQLRKFSDLFRNQSHNLPACSIVPQPTTLLRGQNRKDKLHKILQNVINNLNNVPLVTVNDFIARIELKIFVTNILIK
jgi:hypothetical protein